MVFTRSEVGTSGNLTTFQTRRSGLLFSRSLAMRFWHFHHLPSIRAGGYVQLGGFTYEEDLALIARENWI